MTKKRNQIALGSAVGTVAGLVVLTAALPASAAERSDINDLVPAFATNQNAQDRSLESVSSEAFGALNADSVRWVGRKGTAEYWVARKGNSNVCLVMHIPGGMEVVAVTCAPAEDFYRKGLSLEAGGSPDEPDASAEAYLLPGDVDAGGIVSRPELRTAALAAAAGDRANLIVVEPGKSGLSQAEVAREDGSGFHFVPLDE